MEFILADLQSTQNIKGLVVVIDVLRAFTTCCYIFGSNAKKIIPLADLNKAYALIKENPNYVSVGERKGIKIKGFDYGNSPEEISKINLNGKSVIFTTSAGTQGLIGAKNADEIITGAFVNAQAVINYIKKINPKILSLIITDNKYADNEDFMFAKYITNKLEGKPINFNDIKTHLINHPTSGGFLKTPLTEYAEKDFYLSLDLDRFNFIIKAEKYGNLLILKKYDK